jgi:hypothetical protein
MTLFDTVRRGRFARISLTRREPTEATAVRHFLDAQTSRFFADPR